MALSPDMEEWMAWRGRERRKHRTMTIHEYRMWCVVGDAISYPSEGNAFPGGITIIFEKDRSDGILGKTSDE